MSRFKIIEDYYIGYEGGCCLVCKSPKRPNEPIVALGVEVDVGEGAICAGCVKEMASLVGMVEEGNLGEALLDMETMERRIIELEDILENRKSLEEALRKSLEEVKA